MACYRIPQVAWAVAAAIGLCATHARAEEPRPNVVVLLADNQGPWTLGCYGNPDISTPNIDRLAREGIVFEQCYSSNAVCSPTRATLLTGLIPSQHGVHNYLPAGRPQIGPGAYSTIAEFRSLPEILAESGYVCGLAGKWHLGDNLRPQEGFTTWVTMPHGHTTTFYDAQVIDQGRIRKEPEYLTDFWTDRGVEFIAANCDRPFFLLVAYNGPYGLGASLSHPARNRFADYYADKELRSFPREPMHPWLHCNKRHLNDLASMRRYAAEISGVDYGVGRILAALKEHGLEDDTLVVYTADQGLAGGQGGFWGMGDHTRPRTAYDWTMHVPLVFRELGRIPAGRRSGLLVSNYDCLPTILDHLGLKDKMPMHPPLPGRSYTAALAGSESPWEDVVYFEYEDVRAIRTSHWKYICRSPSGPDELYDLKADPAERTNLVDRPAQAEIQATLGRRMKAFFDRYVDPQYDRTRGGGSKADPNFSPTG